MPPLNSTLKLLATYGEKMISGTISDEEIAQLSDPKNEELKSLGKITDFVKTIGPYLSDETLNSLVQRFLKIESQSGRLFMRNNTLPRYLFAYEFTRKHPMDSSSNGYNLLMGTKPSMLKEYLENPENPIHAYLLTDASATVIRDHFKDNEETVKSVATVIIMSIQNFQNVKKSEDLLVSFALAISTLPQSDSQLRNKMIVLLNVAQHLLQSEEDEEVQQAVQSSLNIMIKKIHGDTAVDLNEISSIYQGLQDRLSFRSVRLTDELDVPVTEKDYLEQFFDLIIWFFKYLFSREDLLEPPLSERQGTTTGSEYKRNFLDTLDQILEKPKQTSDDIDSLDDEKADINPLLGQPTRRK